MPAPVGTVTATEPLKGAIQAVFATGAPIVIVGGVKASLTVALAVFVQPLAAVTVTVYVPAETVLRFWVVAPLLQTKLLPLLVKLTAPL